MNPYFLKKECKELNTFPHIMEFALKKNSTIQFNTLKKETSEFLRFYYVLEGRFDWMIEEDHHILYPGDLAIILPGQCYTGFSPLNYLINIRISEAIKLLKRQDVPVMDVALDVGFYSSQHFATTFKKLTGYTPTVFRKKNIPETE
jgi:hypothetical protein